MTTLRLYTQVATTEKAKLFKAKLAAAGIKANCKKGSGSMKCFYTVYPVKSKEGVVPFTKEQAEAISRLIVSEGNTYNIFNEPCTLKEYLTESCYQMHFQYVVVA